MFRSNSSSNESSLFAASLKKAVFPSGEARSNSLSNISRPVSYTHLDVYKRQGKYILIKSTAKKIYLFLIFVLLYAPIITLMVLSFNNTKTRSKWNGFTGKWYLQLFQNKDIMNALYTTLIIAFLSALIATLIGTAAALGIQAMRTKARTLLLGVTNIPMLNADIVTGISLMLLFIACRFTLGFSTILLAHITFNIPYVILSVMPDVYKRQTQRRIPSISFAFNR